MFYFQIFISSPWREASAWVQYFHPSLPVFSHFCHCALRYWLFHLSHHSEYGKCYESWKGTVQVENRCIPNKMKSRICIRKKSKTNHHTCNLSWLISFQLHGHLRHDGMGVGKARRPHGGVLLLTISKILKISLIYPMYCKYPKYFGSNGNIPQGGDVECALQPEHLQLLFRRRCCPA